MIALVSHGSFALAIVDFGNVIWASIALQADVEIVSKGLSGTFMAIQCGDRYGPSPAAIKAGCRRCTEKDAEITRLKAEVKEQKQIINELATIPVVHVDVDDVEDGAERQEKLSVDQLKKMNKRRRDPETVNAAANHRAAGGHAMKKVKQEKIDAQNEAAGAKEDAADAQDTCQHMITHSNSQTGAIVRLQQLAKDADVPQNVIAKASKLG
jgi:hypothetical protein